MLNFNDVFKSRFIENFTAFSMLDTVIALGLSFLLGMFMMWVYKRSFKGVMYSRGFAMSLLSMNLITTLIILAVTSNVVLSLGMVGALSIVRFRTAIKEPMDIAYLFWSISSGIVLGAGLIPLALIGSAFIGLTMMLFANRKSTDQPYILVFTCNDEKQEKEVLKIVNAQTKHCVIKSKTVTKTGVEMTVELRLENMATEFINKVSNVSGVGHATLVTYNGEYMA